MNKLHAIDIAIVIIYLISCLYLAYRSKDKIKTLKDYAVGGGGYVSTNMLIATFVMTEIGAGDTLGMVQKVYLMGTAMAFLVLIRPFRWFISYYIISKRVEYFKLAGCISVADIAKLMFGPKVKYLVSCLSVLMSIGIISAQITAVGFLFNYFLGIPRLAGIIITLGVVMTYSYFGGIRAVMWTDLLQGIVLLVIITPIAVYAINQPINSFHKLAELPSEYISLSAIFENKLYMLTAIIFGLCPRMESAFLQRCLMASSKPQLKLVLIMSGLCSLCIAFTMVFIGFLCKTMNLNEDIQSAVVFYNLIYKYAPIGVLGIVIAGILSTIMSTLDSHLNTISVLISNNILKELFPKLRHNNKDLKIAKACIFIVGIVSTIIATSCNDLVNIVWGFNSIVLPYIGVPLLIGMIIKKNSFAGVVGAISASSVAWIITYITVGSFNPTTNALLVLVSALGYLIANTKDIDYIQTAINIANKNRKNKNAYITYSNIPNKVFKITEIK